jgi:general secretion pathway protein I
MITLRTKQRGFSLLEILVAFSILALSLGVLMQIFSGSLRNADVTRDQAQAVALAQSLLASAGVEVTLAAGERAGVLDDKFRWLLRVNPFVQEPRAGETDAVQSRLLLDLWVVTVRVAWGGDYRSPERALTLTTLRAQPAVSTP